MTLSTAYAPRHDLQLFRFQEGQTFVCSRCGESKKTKLCAHYGGDQSKRLCNGCYGYLLSVVDIRQKQLDADSKASLLASLLLQGFSRAAKQEAERLFRLSEKRARYLDSLSILFISTADLVESALKDHTDIDWSPAIIGYCKALENEVVNRLILPLAKIMGEKLPKADCEDKDIGRIAKYCNSPTDKPPELGTFAHFLQTFIHSSSRRASSIFMSAFEDLLSTFPNRDWVLAPTGLHAAITTLTRDYRNRAAHLSALSEDDLRACREFTVGCSGIIWRLIDATLSHREFDRA